jgi:hypothetical protein
VSGFSGHGYEPSSSTEAAIFLAALACNKFETNTEEVSRVVWYIFTDVLEVLTAFVG